MASNRRDDGCCEYLLQNLHSYSKSNLLQFKFRLTSTMIVDFMGCWVIEVICKYLFADLEPKPMVTKGRGRREQRRIIEEREKAQNQDELKLQ